MEVVTGRTCPSITLRQATLADVPALLRLNVLAYPVLAAENVVWSEQQLESHQRIFPGGQLVAEQAGRLVGAAATLLISLGADPLRHHSWSEATARGYFTNHDPSADTLYGADVYVLPEARGQGVGAALYEARRQLCRRLNKRRIVAGGRLWNYVDADESLAPEEYAALAISITVAGPSCALAQAGMNEGGMLTEWSRITVAS